MKFLKVHFVSKWCEPAQMPHFAASDLVLHCLPMSHKKDKGVNTHSLSDFFFIYFWFKILTLMHAG